MKIKHSPKSNTGLPLRKIQKQSVTDDVEKQLRDAILSGALVPGEPLPEAQLASQFGVSRASVRQAKFQLAREELLDFDDRGTAIVRTLTTTDVYEINEFRQALEMAAARLACTRLTDDAIAAIEENIQRTEQERDMLKLTLLDIAFHEEIIRATCNSRLMAAWFTLRPQLELWLAGMHRRHSAVTAQTCEITANGHRVLLEALRSGDPNIAEQAMRQHTTWLENSHSMDPVFNYELNQETGKKGSMP